MSATPTVIAVYGTLRRGERNAPLLEGARFLGSGRIRGRLHAVPRSTIRPYAYPALLLDGPGIVAVELFELRDAAALADIDRLEAYDPADEAGSEYVRREVAIEGGPTETAWTYVFNGSATDVGEPIPSGDWVIHVGRADRG